MRVDPTREVSMALIKVDERKHPHPRRYRRALGLMITGVIVGIVMTIFGLAFVPYGYDGSRAWLVAFSILGPAVVFLTAVGYATYMESLEKRTYGEAYEGEIPPVRAADGFRQA